MHTKIHIHKHNQSKCYGTQRMSQKEKEQARTVIE